MRLLLLLLATLFQFSSAFGPKTTTHTNTWGVSPQRTTPTAGGQQLPTAAVLKDEGYSRRSTTAFGLSTTSSITGDRSAMTALHAAASSTGGSDGPVKIIIAGAPASGKGTQCEIIKEKYGVVHLSTGDMLRAAVAAKTDVGKKAKEYMDSGKLVPDEVIIGVVKDRLGEEDCQSKGWLLDGFPRTQAQAKALEDSGVEADCFVFLNVPDEILVERVVGRRTDPETGKIYHMKFSPPDDEEVLARLEQRSDDTEEKVKVRLKQFHDNVDAVKDSYTEISVTIDGNQAPADVSKAIFAAIESKVAA